MINKLLTLTLTFSLFFISCSDVSDEEKTTPKDEEKIEQVKLIPIRITDIGTNISYGYQYDESYRLTKAYKKDSTNALMFEISYDSINNTIKSFSMESIGVADKFTYNSSKDSAFINHSLQTIADRPIFITFDSNTKRALHHRYTDNYINPEGLFPYQEYEHINGNQSRFRLIKYTGYNDTDRWAKWTYDYQYTYDDKNGAFSSVETPSWFMSAYRGSIGSLFSDISILVNITKNNVIRTDWNIKIVMTDTGEVNRDDFNELQTFEYTYNEHNYPETIVATYTSGTSKGKVSTYKIEYMEIN